MLVEGIEPTLGAL